MTTTQITSALNTKQIAHYFQKCGRIVYAERIDENGEFLLSDKFILVRVLASDLFGPLTSFDPTWQRAVLSPGETIHEGSPADNMIGYWQRHLDAERQPLTLTHDLLEVPGTRGKRGTLYRKLVFGNDQGTVYIDRGLLDVLSIDLDDLESFGFEGTGCDDPICVAARYGYVAIIKPATIRKQ